MSFVVGALPHSGWEHAVPLLEKLGWIPQQAQDVETWPDPDTGVTPVVILHRRPEYLIASAIAAGCSPDEACSQWVQQASKLLTWLKFNRRRACLVETDALLSADADLLRLCERLGVTHVEHSPVSAPPPDTNPLHLLFALQAVSQSEQCQALVAELEASTLPLADISFVRPVVGLDELAQQLNDSDISAQAEMNSARVLIEQQKQQTHELERQLSELTQSSLQQAQVNDDKLQQSRKETLMLEQQLQTCNQESSLLLDQLHLVQEELERVLVREKQQAETNQQQVQTYKQDLKRQTAELANAQTELTELRAEHDALLARYKAATTKLQQLEKQSLEWMNKARSAEAELKNEKAAVHKLKEQGAQLQQQLDAVHAELKQLGDKQEAFKKTEEDSKRDKQLLQQENHLLLEQLHLVQEALEQKFHSQQHVELALHDSDAALAVANGEIAKLQNELNGIKASRFYNLVKPAEPKPKNKAAANKRKLRHNIRKLKASSLFDAEWYLMTHTDVAREKMDPAGHYIKFGAAEGRDPSPHFNTSWYLQVNPDVAETGINPLIHYIEHGKAEGRAPRPEEQGYLPGPRG